MSDIRYAGFWIRAAANLLDLLMLWALNAVLVTAGFGVYVGNSRIDGATGAVSGSYDATAAVLVVLLPMVLVIGFWIVKGATPGKMICGLRIVDADTGARPAAWQFLFRYLMAAVSALCAGLGYLWIVFDPREQALHDRAASTVVVRTRPAPGATAPGSSAGSSIAGPARYPS
jgi:uncharacterized RDD family membrane protein YckC